MDGLLGFFLLEFVLGSGNANVLGVENRQVPLSPVSKFFVGLLVTSGFAELYTIKNVEEPQELQPGIKDAYLFAEEIK